MYLHPTDTVGEAGEWAIRDVARATGLTSRTLRHYEEIGLLQPSRVGHGGYRYYGEPELVRLYRVLTLRALGMPLAEIHAALTSHEEASSALTTHLALLKEKQRRTAAQITAVERSLHAITNGRTMTMKDLLTNFDPAGYEDEVRARWGDDAWERSQHHRDALTPGEREAEQRRTVDVNAALREAAETGIAPDDVRFGEAVAAHYAWVAEQWGGRPPTQEAYLGLASMYVADPRFAAVYGGEASAEIVRTAIAHWARANL